MNDRQGKCVKCKVRWVWRGGHKVELSSAHCPRCGTALQRTTHLSTWPVRRAQPVPSILRGWVLGAF